MIPGAEEVGKTTRSFFDALKEQPLSLALVVMNFLLVAFLFYSGGQQLAQRQQTTDIIIQWQKQTDQLMANCVSQDVTKMVIDNIQRVTETMLATAQKDIERMQKAIDIERANSQRIVEEQLKRLQRYQPPPGLPFVPQCRRACCLRPGAAVLHAGMIWGCQYGNNPLASVSADGRVARHKLLILL